MNELLIIAAIAIVLLLIIILIIFIARKRISNKEKLINNHEFPEPAMQAEENKLANKLKVDTEPNKEALCPTETNSELIVASKTNKTASQSHKVSNDNLPQDFMLRRHYLTNLRAMLESISPPRPTDAALRRHHDSILHTEIEQCLCDKGAVERLICNYENHKKRLTQQPQPPKTLTKPLLKTEIKLENPKLPEDSMLRRHAITNLYAMVESNMPIRPTDSVLRRHYDTMINTKVNNLLG